MSRRVQSLPVSSGIAFLHFLRKLKPPPPVSLFLGDEFFFFRRAVAELIKRIPEEFRAFNVATFWLPDDSFEAAVRAARELPFGGERRLVVIRNLERGLKSRVIEEDDEETEDPGPGMRELLAFVADPSPATILVLQAAKLDGRRREVVALRSKSVVVDSGPLDETSVREWVRGRLKELDLQLDRTAESALLSRVGTNLERLDTELEKLSIYAAGTSVSAAEIERLITTEAEFRDFALTDAMLSCDSERALRVLHQELENGSFGTPLMMLGAIASSYRRLFAARALSAKELSRADCERISRVRPYNRFEFTRHPHIRRMDKRACVRALQRIAAADLAIKTSLSTPRMQLELLVVELSSPAFWTNH